MATKKKKKTPAPKAKKAAKKKAKPVAVKKKTAGKRIVIGKTVTVTKKKAKAKKIARKKIAVKAKVKRPLVKKPLTPVTTHGPDMNLIPVRGEIHPARIEETHQIEKNYKHNEETALHTEQQRVKQMMGMTRGGGKRIFKNRGQR